MGMERKRKMPMYEAMKIMNTINVWLSLEFWKHGNYDFFKLFFVSLKTQIIDEKNNTLWSIFLTIPNDCFILFLTLMKIFTNWNSNVAYHALLDSNPGVSSQTIPLKNKNSCPWYTSIFCLFCNKSLKVLFMWGWYWILCTKDVLVYQETEK